MRRGLPAVQPGAGEPDRGLLLVGLGADLRAHRADGRVGAAFLVSACGTGGAACRRHRLRIHVPEPARDRPGHPRGAGHRCRVGNLGLVERGAAAAARGCRSRPHGRLGPHNPVCRGVRRGHQRDGRALPDRVCRPGVRGGDVSCRGDGQPGPGPAAGDAAVRRHGRPVLRGPARGVAGSLWCARTERRQRGAARAKPRPDVLAAVRRARQECRDLVPGPQHVPRHGPAPRGRGPHPVPARRRRTAAPHGPAPQPLRRAMGGDLPDGRVRSGVPAGG